MKNIELIDLHIHTNLSSDSDNQLEKVAGEAKRKGLRVIGITNHIPELPGFIWYNKIEALYKLKEKAKKLEKAKGVKILIGVEATIMDYNGTLTLPDSFLKECDIVIAAVHRCHMGFSTKKDYLVPQDTLARFHYAIPDYYKQMLGALKNPYVDTVAHPMWALTQMLSKTEDRELIFKNFPDIYREDIAKSAKKQNKAIELNSIGLPDDAFLRIIKDNKTKITIGSDAHKLSDVGEISWQLAKIKEFGFTNKDMLVPSK